MHSDDYESDREKDGQLIPNASVDESMDIGIMNSKRKEMQNVRMESDGGGEDDTQRIAHGRGANEGLASFGVVHGAANGFGSEQQQDESVLAKWAHKERTLNGTVSFKAHLEDEPNVFSSRANLIDIDEIQLKDGAEARAGISHAMP